MPKESSQCKYYPRVFLEECKYVRECKSVKKYITDDTEVSSDDSDKKNSYEEN